MALDENLINMVDQRIRLATARTRAIGRCVSRDTTGPGANVTFDGSTVAMPVKVLGNVTLRAGDRCVLDLYGTEWIVTGSFTAPALGEASIMVAPSATTGALTSFSFVDLQEIPAIDFNKMFDGTYVRMAIMAGCYVTAQPTSVRFGLRLNPIDAPGYTASDISITFINFNTANAHNYATNAVRVLDIPAGKYSAQLRWRRAAGTGSVFADGNDLFTIEIDEGVRFSAPVL